MNKLILSYYLLIVVLLTICISMSPGRYLYDEPLHLEGAKMLAEGSTLYELLTSPLPSAAGPIYPLLHSSLSKFTGFQAPAIRFVNLSLLILCILATAVSFKLLYNSKSAIIAGMLLCVPMVWVTTGMALTEIPALFMASVGLMCVAWAIGQDNSWLCCAGFILAGIFAGLCILGRQTYLPVLLAFPGLAILMKCFRLQALLGLLIACAITVPVFIVWGGLTPPSQSHAGGGFNIQHGILALAYLAIIMVIIVPNYFLSKWRTSIVAGLVGAFANATVVGMTWQAMMSLSITLPEFLRASYPLACGSILMALACGLLAVTALHIWERQDDHKFILMTFLSLLLTATACGITHLFSSRYLMAGFPFILGMAQPYFRITKSTFIIATLGTAAGCASLLSYYR